MCTLYSILYNICYILSRLIIRLWIENLTLSILSDLTLVDLFIGINREFFTTSLTDKSVQHKSYKHVKISVLSM